MLFKFKKAKPAPPILKMVVPGRRALGETWSEVTLRPNPDGDFTLETKPAEQAPAMGVPVIIPAMANLSSEEVDFILKGALKAQEYESRKPRRRPVTDREIHRMVNQMWRDYVEQKIHAFKGDSQFGPFGKTQRESFGGDHNFNRHMRS